MSYSIEYKKKAKKFLDEHPKEKTKFDEAFKGSRQENADLQR